MFKAWHIHYIGIGQILAYNSYTSLYLYIFFCIMLADILISEFLYTLSSPKIKYQSGPKFITEERFDNSHKEYAEAE